MRDGELLSRRVFSNLERFFYLRFCKLDSEADNELWMEYLRMNYVINDTSLSWNRERR